MTLLTPYPGLMPSLGHLWELAHGMDEREVTPWEAAKSIGAETTFGEDTDDPQRIRKTLLRLAEHSNTIIEKEPGDE